MRIFSDQEIEELKTLLFGKGLTLADLLVAGDLIKKKYQAEVDPFNLFKESGHHPLDDYCTELNQALGSLIFSTSCYGKAGRDYEITSEGLALSVRDLIMKREGLGHLQTAILKLPFFGLLEHSNIQYHCMRVRYSQLFSELRTIDLPNVSWRSGIEANLPSSQDPKAVMVEQILQGACLE